VFDTGSTRTDAGTVPYIVMEFVDGDTLRDVLKKEGPLVPRRAMEIVADVCAALDFSHRHGIVHRDVKPANVMLGRDGSIKVTDFGIADLVAAASNAEGLVFGTPGYLPPESLRGLGQGKPGDLFALGVILYESLCGAKPFGGIEASDVVQATLFGAVRPLRGRTEAGVPRELESLVLLLLERDPDRRPSDAAAVAEELERMAAARGLRWTLNQDGGKAAAAPGAPSFTVEAQWIPTAAVRGEVRARP